MSGLVVLGGGIAGISAAYTAYQKGSNAKIFEARNSWGGLLDNFTINGFRFDHAIHLSFAKDSYVRSIFDKTPYIKHTPSPINYEQGIWLKHPVQNNLYPLPIEEKMEAIESFISRPENKEATNYYEWLEIQYGKYIAERFPVKYTKKYWTITPENLSVDWVGNRMYRPNLKELLYGAFSNETPHVYYAGEMRYPEKGGFRSFLNPMVEKCSIQTNKRAISINNRFKYVEFADGEKVYFEKLISSIPLPELISLLQDVPPIVKEAASSLWATSVALVSIGFNKPNIPKNLWFYIYDESILASRAYSPNLKSPDNTPMNCSSLQFEIYFSKNKPLPMNLNSVVEHTVESVEKMGLASKNDILFADGRMVPYANVVFDHEMMKCRKVIREFLKGSDIFPVGRFGEWDYFWSDQSLLSGKRAMDSILLSLGGQQ